MQAIRDARNQASIYHGSLWKRQLEGYDPPAPDAAIDEALREFIERKEASRPDDWYRERARGP